MEEGRIPWAKRFQKKRGIRSMSWAWSMGMDLLVRSSGQDGIFIGGWLVGSGLLVGHGKGLLLGGVCDWHYGGGYM